MTKSKLFTILIGDSNTLLGTEKHLVVLGEPALEFEIVEDDVVVVTGGGTPDGFGILPVN